MDDDALLKHFNNSRLEDLIDLADENSRFRKLIATHTAINRFHIDEKLIYFEIREYKHMEKVEMKNDLIQIGDRLIAFKLLRNFGHMISKMYIEQRILGPKSTKWHPEIDKYINEYCSDSLKELKIESHVYGSTYNLDIDYAWKKPFEQLTNLNIEAISDERFFIYRNKSFSEIFPSLRTMTIRLKKNSDCIVDHFPHLEQATFSNIKKNEFLFFELNSHIRSLRIEDRVINDIKTLRRTSELLQNLEFIRLEMDFPLLSDESNELIHFKKIKKFILSIPMYDVYPPILNIPIVFDQLEEMEINQWIDNNSFKKFLELHKTLKSFTYSSDRALLVQFLPKLLMVAENLPNLVELNVNCVTFFDEKEIESLVAVLLNGKTNLKKISITCILKIEIEKLRNLLAPRWKTECNSMLTLPNVLTLTRK